MDLFLKKHVYSFELPINLPIHVGCGAITWVFTAAAPLLLYYYHHHYYYYYYYTWSVLSLSSADFFLFFWNSVVLMYQVIFGDNILKAV